MHIFHPAAYIQSVTLCFLSGEEIPDDAPLCRIETSRRTPDDELCEYCLAVRQVVDRATAEGYYE